MRREPNQNGHIESFHEKFRDECLNRELFGSLLEALVIVENWRMECNENRPHRSLRYLTPSEYDRRHNPISKQTHQLYLCTYTPLREKSYFRFFTGAFLFAAATFAATLSLRALRRMKPVASP